MKRTCLFLLPLLISLTATRIIPFTSASNASEMETETVRRIRISPPKSFVHFSFPVALFDHERHSAALGNDTKSCAGCHPGFPDIVSYRIFPQDTEEDVLTITEGYHDFCKKCHIKENKGPQACDGCHLREENYSPSLWAAPSVNLLEHQKHSDSAGGNCRKCHHNFDYRKPAKETEFNCRACHQKKSADKVPALKDAVHTACIKCHAGNPKRTVGILCAGCHPAPGGKIQDLEDMSGAARLDIGQRDSFPVSSSGEDFPSVPFNHSGHEKKVRSCSTCHHKNMESCITCHAPSRDNPDSTLNLANSMHELNSIHSCVGCHNRVKQGALCSICHYTLPALPTDSSCLACHAGGDAASKPKHHDPDSLIPADMPEKFFIDAAKNKYEPVVLHHRSMVSSANRIVQGNSLADVFHGDKPVICNFCHHKDAGSDRKRSCRTCHPAQADGKKPGIPPLADVFHTRCAVCHSAMKISAPRNCSFCHKDIKR